MASMSGKAGPMASIPRKTCCSVSICNSKTRFPWESLTAWNMSNSPIPSRTNPPIPTAAGRENGRGFTTCLEQKGSVHEVF